MFQRVWAEYRWGLWGVWWGLHSQHISDPDTDFPGGWGSWGEEWKKGKEGSEATQVQKVGHVSRVEGYWGRGHNSGRQTDCLTDRQLWPTSQYILTQWLTREGTVLFPSSVSVMAHNRCLLNKWHVTQEPLLQRWLWGRDDCACSRLPVSVRLIFLHFMYLRLELLDCNPSSNWMHIQGHNL